MCEAGGSTSCPCSSPEQGLEGSTVEAFGPPMDQTFIRAPAVRASLGRPMCSDCVRDWSGRTNPLVGLPWNVGNKADKMGMNI